MSTLYPWKPGTGSIEVRRLLEAAKAKGRPDHYEGKRKSKRYNAGLPCELTTDPAKDLPIFVNLHNVSAGGFACWCKKYLSAHTRIFIREFAPDRPPAWIPARVSHCTAGIRGYLIGAFFERPLPSETCSTGTATQH
jgi:hypothetical protein